MQKNEDRKNYDVGTESDMEGDGQISDEILEMLLNKIVEINYIDHLFVKNTLLVDYCTMITTTSHGRLRNYDDYYVYILNNVKETNDGTLTSDIIGIYRPCITTIYQMIDVIKADVMDQSEVT